MKRPLAIAIESITGIFWVVRPKRIPIIEDHQLVAGPFLTKEEAALEMEERVRLERMDMKAEMEHD